MRMEPFLSVKGRLQKDGASLNVIAYEVTALRVPGVSVRRSGMASQPDLQTSLPRTMEYWIDPNRAGLSSFRYLTALRQSPPGIKSFG